MRRVRLGLFAAGLATFALLYTPQPLLPLLSRAFAASPAAASLAMSAGTAALAVAIIPVSSLSEVCGRRAVMTVSVLAAAVLGLVAPFSVNLPMLVGVRVLQGFALAGVPATAMAYLAEEVDRGDLGRAMGLYIAGNAIGGLSGRVIAGFLAEHGGWRVAIAGVSALALACAVTFALALPRSAFFTPSPLSLRTLGGTLARNLADSGLLRLYLIGFALMGAFVTVYNYLTFRLSMPPFGLSTSVIGALFTVYLVGTYSSTLAGRLADRAGRYGVLAAGVVVAIGGVALTLPASVGWIVVGLIALTAGFFAAHSVASGWVGGRARVAPAQASALYLCLYYIGSSVAGSVGGVFWARGGWPAVAAFAVALLAVALLSALSLARMPELPDSRCDSQSRDTRAACLTAKTGVRAGSPCLVGPAISGPTRHGESAEGGPSGGGGVSRAADRANAAKRTRAGHRDEVRLSCYAQVAPASRAGKRHRAFRRPSRAR